MNVRTVKRMSKRTVSTLLSVLMVISLFTVCMVGTATIVSAANTVTAGSTIFYDNSKTNWSDVYYYYGGKNSGKYQVKSVKMTRIAGTNIWRARPAWGIDEVYGIFFANRQETQRTWYDENEAGYDDCKRTESGSNTAIVNDVESRIRNDGGKATWIITHRGLSGRELVIPQDSSGKINKSSVVDVNNNAVSSKTVYFDATNCPFSINDDKVYLYYGSYAENRSSHHHVRKDTLTKVAGTDNLYSATIHGFSSGMYGYFFSANDNVDILQNGTDDKLLDVVWSGLSTHTPLTKDNIPENLMAKFNSDGSIKYTIKSDNVAWIDATLYNYRTKDQIAKANAISGTLSEAQNFAIDTRDGMSNNTKNLMVYETYDRKVDDWFRDKNTGTDQNKVTPLYQGNFNDLEDENMDFFRIYDGSNYQPTPNGAALKTWDENFRSDLYHFLFVANSTNHQYGNGNGYCDTGLVDENIGTGTLTQQGIELPQFSDTFMSQYASDKIQGKYDNLKFQVKTTTHAKSGNTWYSYDSSKDGNRYLDLEERKVVAGPSVRGAAYMGGWGSNGYYPLNALEPDDPNNIINCMGSRFDIEFYMTKDGKFNGEDMNFTFTGDDDVWVYIDGYLVLDMGGAHNKATGSINLNKTDGNITSEITSGAYHAVWHSDYTYDNQGKSVNWGGGSASKTTTFDSSKDVYKSLQDTTVPHKITIFYLERGLYDSNLSFSYMLPSAEDINKLTLSHTVNADSVNEGLRLETMTVANNDIFDVEMKTQHMDKGGDNLVSLPIDKNFERMSPEKSQLNSGKTDLLQKKEIGSDTVSNKKSDDAGGNAYRPIRAYYSWQDDSYQLKQDGKTIFTDGSDNEVKSSTGKGVGVPVGGKVSLLYDQSAIFFNQFPGKVVDGTSTPLINFQLLADMGKFTNVNNNTNGILNQYVFSTTEEPREHGHFYTASVLLTGGNWKEQLNGGGEFYVNTKDIKIEYEHVIKTGSISIEKALSDPVEDNDTDEANNQYTEYNFRVEYRNLFGNGDTTWKKANLWDATMESSGYTDSSSRVDAGTHTTSVGVVGLRAGERATFSGIPVDTEIRITELSTENGITNKLAKVSTVVFTGKSYNGTSEKLDIAERTIAPSLSQEEGQTVYTVNMIPYETDDDKPAGLSDSFKNSKKNDEMNWNDEYNYKFVNSYARTPILYRYVDRRIVNGLPTDMQDGYTYFTKVVSGGINSYFDGGVLAANKAITNEAKKNIEAISPEVTNVLKSYSLSDTKGKFGYVAVNKTNGTYTIVGHSDGTVWEKWNDWGTDGINSIGLRASLDSIFEEKDDTVSGGVTMNIILAEYAHTDKEYDVTVEYLNPESNETVKPYLVKVVRRKFNEVADLVSVLKNDSDLNADNLSNVLYQIQAKGKDYYFAYWEREVTYYTGNVLHTEYIPVSTNFNYGYRVTDNVRIRAVYVREKVDGETSDYYRYDPLNENDIPYVHFQEGKTPFIGYDEIRERKVIRYWQKENGVKKYSPSPSGPFTYTAENCPWTTLEDTMTNRINGYCVPNADGGRGYATTATDRLYNSYSKEVATTTGPPAVTTYTKQDWTRVDIMFGTTGTYDNDKDISEVGYLLIKKKNGYVEIDNDLKQTVKNIITNYKDTIDNNPPTAEDYENVANGVDGAESVLNDKLQSDGTLAVMYKSKTSGSPCYNKGYDCLLGKMDVVGIDYGNGSDGKGTKYVTNEATGKISAVAVDVPYNALGAGKVNLTNKNRFDLVFDFENNESTRKYCYTCYTYMKRGNTLYISEVPTTFAPKDVNPEEKNPEGKKSYIIYTKAFVEHESSLLQASQFNSSMNSTFATAIDGKTLSFKATPYQSGAPLNYGGSRWYTELDRIVVGNKVYSYKNGSAWVADYVLEPEFHASSEHAAASGEPTDAYNHINIKDSKVDVVAYFKFILATASFNIAKPAGATVNVSAVTGNIVEGAGAVSDNTTVKVEYGTKVRVDVRLEKGYKWNNDEPENDFIQDGSDASLRYKEFTLNDDGSNAGSLATVFSTLPSVKAVEYTLNVSAGSGGRILSIKKQVGSGAQVDVSGAEFTHTYAEFKNENITYTITAQANTNYNFKDWTVSNISSDFGSESTNTYTYTYTFKEYGSALPNENATVTANFKSAGITLTWKPDNKVWLTSGYSWGVYYWGNGNNGTGEYMNAGSNSTFTFTIPTNCDFKICMLDNSGNRRSSYELDTEVHAGTSNITVTATGWTTNDPPMINYTTS